MGSDNAVSLEKSWEIWTDCLKGSDENSIFQQISVMIWDTAIFRFVLESRQIQVGKYPNNPPLNVSLHSFMDRNYFQAQAAFIRRLADKSRYGLIGNKGIYSLYALIDDIGKRRTELTRETFFVLRRIPYDVTKLQKGKNEFIAQQLKENRSAFWIPPEYDWETSAEAHITFDRLCGVQAQDRKPQDFISESIFSRLKDRLDLCSDITNYVDKYVAHSATPESRTIENVDSAKITLRHIWNAHQIIYEVAEFLSLILFSEGHVPLALKSPNLFDNWESPLLEVEDINRLETVYKEYGEETTKWQLEGVDNLWKWIEEYDS